MTPSLPTPIHVALLGLYGHKDKARPSLAALLSFIEDADNEPTDTNWKTWRLEDQKKSPLFREIVYIYKYSRNGVRNCGRNGVRKE
jgi:hypothetical protein